MGKHHISRRKFLGQASCGAMGLTTMFSTLSNLKLLQKATAYNTSLTAGGGDYKALVCILLSGGNDSYNMLAPKGPEYGEYATTRSNLAVAENDLIDINQMSHPGRNFGIHPSMPNLALLFNGSTSTKKSGNEDANVAFISNIGSIIEPITKQQFYDGSVPVPLGLYSHADQVMHWQTGIPHDRVAQGWGGKMADLLAQGNPAYNEIGMNISMSGTNLFQTGNVSFEYAVDPEYGSVGIAGYEEGGWIFDDMKTAKIKSLVDYNHQNLFKKAYVDMVDVGIRGNVLFNEAMDATPSLDTSFTYHDDGYLRYGQSMEMIARMISARERFGVNRQIFFVDFGGWDHHEAFEDHTTRLSWLDTSLAEFNNAMKEIGVQDCVTTFCLSEFSRTLASNGSGSDHAWGGNIFVMGGAVSGRDIYGTYPSLVLDNSLEVGGGVLIPTLSCDEYFAELAMWFGVPSSDLTMLYPNLPNFYSVGSGKPIGFMHL